VPPEFVTTYVIPWHEEWSARTLAVARWEGRLAALRRIVTEAPRLRGAILHGAVSLRDGYVDLLAAAALGRRGVPVVLDDATWQPGSRALDRLLGRRRTVPGVDVPGRHGRRLTRSAVGLIDRPSVHFVVLSSEERRSFPATWGVPPERVHVVPFCATAPDDGPAPRTAGVFAGGDSLRDYRPLLQAAGSIHAPVRVATRLPVPPSAAQAGPLAPDDYARQARAARVVVVPLQAATGRSGGQQTYLNAMLQAKPVVVTDAPGVRDHVVDGMTGLVVPPGDVAALANAVNRLLDDAELASRLGAAAREAVLARFTARHRFDALLALASRIAA
jgi:hypothetical protein